MSFLAIAVVLLFATVACIEGTSIAATVELDASITPHVDYSHRFLEVEAERLLASGDDDDDDDSKHEPKVAYYVAEMHCYGDSCATNDDISGDLVNNYFPGDPNPNTKYTYQLEYYRHTWHQKKAVGAIFYGQGFNGANDFKYKPVGQPYGHGGGGSSYSGSGSSGSGGYP